MTTGPARPWPTTWWVESNGTPGVVALPTIITAHSFSVVKEMYLGTLAATFRIQASSRQGLRQAKIRASDGASRRGLILVTKFTIIGTLLPLSRPFQRQIGHTLKYRVE
jgi:hypothetical protein